MSKYSGSAVIIFKYNKDTEYKLVLSIMMKENEIFCQALQGKL